MTDLEAENRRRLTQEIADYLTKQFVWDRISEMPKDECLSEARHVLSMIDSALAKAKSGHPQTQEPAM